MKMCFHYHYFQVMLSIFDRREKIAKLFRLFLGTFVSLRLIRRKATQCATAHDESHKWIDSIGWTNVKMKHSEILIRFMSYLWSLPIPSFLYLFVPSGRISSQYGCNCIRVCRISLLSLSFWNSWSYVLRTNKNIRNALLNLSLRCLNNNLNLFPEKFSTKGRFGSNFGTD